MTRDIGDRQNRPSLSWSLLAQGFAAPDGAWYDHHGHSWRSSPADPVLTRPAPRPEPEWSSAVSTSLASEEDMRSQASITDNNLESVWSQFSGQLRSFIRSRVSDEQTAEDILQDVFLRIHAHMGTLKDLGKLQGWIYQITRNAIIDHYRTERPSSELPEDLVSGEDGYDEDLIASLAADVREMAEALPEPYREAFMLTAYGGLSQKQLAERLGLSYTGAKSRVQRARQRVRDMLMTCCHFEFDRRGMVIDYHQPHCCCCALAQEAG